MQSIRRPETAQGRTGFWESGTSNPTLTADSEVAAVVRDMRGENYHSVLFELLDLFAEARADEDGTLVDARAFIRARNLLDTLPNGYAVPEVGLDPDGEISVDWLKPNREMVSVSIPATGDVSFAARLRDRKVFGTLQFSENFPAALSDLLRNLYHPG